MNNLPVPLIIFCCTLLCAVPAHADIYRFVTIDGVETFTNAPIKTGARLVVKETMRHPNRQIAKTHPRGGRQRPPSLREIVEKTIQAQMTPQGSGSPLEPVLPVSGPITSGVGMRIDPIDGVWRHHNGIDIAVAEGTPVKAIGDGTVIFAGLRSGYGLTVLLEHDNGMITLYAHNSRIVVTAGQSVKKGETISLAGSTGRSTGPHVHFEAWQAGNNITTAFLPGSGMMIAATPGYHRHARATFRQQVLADGSLLITNLPNGIP